MGLVSTIKRWWVSHRGRPLKELLAVEFDDQEVRVRVLAELETDWNQTFEWSQIIRVCFKDGGMRSSDVVYLTLRDRETVAQIPTEANNGHLFFGELCNRRLFPEAVWRKAVGDTSGGMHCWPPFEK
jgi:hypothetical protein